MPTHRTHREVPIQHEDRVAITAGILLIGTALAVVLVAPLVARFLASLDLPTPVRIGWFLVVAVCVFGVVARALRDRG